VSQLRPSVGYAGRILEVDLSVNEIKWSSFSSEFAKKYIGMCGFNAKLLWDLLPPNIDPLSPQNILVFSAGALSGTAAPATPKTEAAALSPITGFYGASVCSMMGPMMKYAGFDVLVVKGKAKSPVYLKIEDDVVEILNAEWLWGKDVFEATQELWKELGDDYCIACIGPAGENLVRFACILVNRMYHFARTGLGAVMGSKNLKAIAIKGTKGIEVAKPERFQELVDVILDRLLSHPYRDLWCKLGSLISYDMWFGLKPNMGHVTRKNSTEDASIGAKIFNPDEFLSRIKHRPLACLNCPISEKAWIKIRDGRYAGLSYPVSDVAGSCVVHGQQLGFQSFDDAIKFHEICNRLGMDVFSCSNVIAFAIEILKRGILAPAEVDNIKLEWGDPEPIFELAKKIAFREGLGKILAEDIGRAASIIGRGSEKYALAIKNMSWNYFDPRVWLSVDHLGALTCIIGPHPNREASLLLVPRSRDAVVRYLERMCVPKQEIERAWPHGSEREDIAVLTKWVEDINTALWSLGICTRPPIVRAYTMDICSELFSAATGLEISPTELLEAGERIWNLQKSINVRHSKLERSRAEYRFPHRYCTEKIYISGHDRTYDPVDQKIVDDLVIKYFKERGWDPDTGIPTRVKLAKLGLDFVDLSNLT